MSKSYFWFIFASITVSYKESLRLTLQFAYILLSWVKDFFCKMRLSSPWDLELNSVDPVIFVFDFITPSFNLGISLNLEKN